MTTGIKIIQPSGIFDGTYALEFRQEIKEKITSDIEVVLIDFQNVTFMDSSGLGALVLALKTVRSQGGSMYLCNINEQIKMLFELTGMDRVFDVYANRQAFEAKFPN